LPTGHYLQLTAIMTIIDDNTTAKTLATTVIDTVDEVTNALDKLTVSSCNETTTITTTATSDSFLYDL
jgi:hypothetical protein